MDIKSTTDHKKLAQGTANTSEFSSSPGTARSSGGPTTSRRHRLACRREKHRVVQSQPLQLHDQLPNRQHGRNVGAAKAQQRRDLERSRIPRASTIRMGSRSRREQSRTLGVDEVTKKQPCESCS